MINEKNKCRWHFCTNAQMRTENETLLVKAVASRKYFYERVELKHHFLLREMMEQREANWCRRERGQSQKRCPWEAVVGTQVKWLILQAGTHLLLQVRRQSMCVQMKEGGDTGKGRMTDPGYIFLPLFYLYLSKRDIISWENMIREMWNIVGEWMWMKKDGGFLSLFRLIHCFSILCLILLISKSLILKICLC